MHHNFHILFLIIALPILAQEGQEVVRVAPHFGGTGGDGWALGSVGVTRRGRAGLENASYIVTDRKLDELRLQYGELLNPDELQGKKVLDSLGTGGGSLVTSIRYYGKTLCRQGQNLLQEAKVHESNGKGLNAQGEATERLGQALMTAGESILGKTNLGTAGETAGLALCGIGDSFCRQAEELKMQGEGYCQMANDSRNQGLANIQRGNGIKGSFADMHGIDIALPPHLKALTDEHGKPFLIQGDAAKTPYQNEEFDRLFSSWSIFIYEGANKDLMDRTFREANRILKTGGMLTISPVLDTHMRGLREIVKNAGFELTRSVKKGPGFDPSHEGVKGTFYNIELKKVGPATPVVAQAGK